MDNANNWEHQMHFFVIYLLIYVEKVHISSLKHLGQHCYVGQQICLKVEGSHKAVCGTEDWASVLKIGCDAADARSIFGLHGLPAGIQEKTAVCLNQNPGSSTQQQRFSGFSLTDHDKKNL
ncbi:hypothetical protein F7725_016445 [Dissostichus mawsoni]|uniref:Uncharacterized protein n=1 Tax=Dissostichus mawsoni TaxID=36200 RepID=A0A7J5Z1M8_DISMA|nr:hypothetical protein F7725_016445 [Dissostichus mawsoni]